jgi:hypothetical protein
MFTITFKMTISPEANLKTVTATTEAKVYGTPVLIEHNFKSKPSQD